MKKKIKNVVITSFMGIGNTINLIPLAEYFKKQNKKVYFLIWDRGAFQVIEKNNFIGGVILIPKEKLIIKNLLFALMLRKKINPKQTLFISSYPSGPRREKFIRFFYRPKKYVKINRQDKKHDVLVNLKYFDKNAKYRCPKIFIEEKYKKIANKYLKNKKIIENEIIGIHPGSNNKLKNLPSKDFCEIIKKEYKKNKNVRFLIFFGPSEKGEIKVFEKELKNLISKEIVNFVHNENLKIVMALIKKCKIFISNDSGLMHIAEGVGVKKIHAFFINSKIYRNAPLNKKENCYTSKEGFLNESTL